MKIRLTSPKISLIRDPVEVFPIICLLTRSPSTKLIVKGSKIPGESGGGERWGRLKYVQTSMIS